MFLTKYASKTQQPQNEVESQCVIDAKLLNDVAL